MSLYRKFERRSKETIHFVSSTVYPLKFPHRGLLLVISATGNNKSLAYCNDCTGLVPDLSRCGEVQGSCPESGDIVTGKDDVAAWSIQLICLVRLVKSRRQGFHPVDWRRTPMALCSASETGGGREFVGKSPDSRLEQAEPNASESFDARK